MDLTVLLEPELDLERLAEVLDGMGHEGRVHTIRGWEKKQQAKIFEAAKGFRPLNLEHFVPAGTAPLSGVAHDGQNTLPMFSHFQKVFCRAPNDDAVLWGFNNTSTMGLTGPGYYVARKSDVEGEVAIDYRSIPSDKPAEWPALRPNDGLGALVYGGMIDYMRGISDHVSIGRAEKGGKLMDAWFVLVRKDPN